MNRLDSVHTAAVRLVLIARRRLDCDALAALFREHIGFRVLCTTTSIKVACEIAQHRNPDLLVMDGSLISHSDDCRLFSVDGASLDHIPVLVLDDDVNNGRLAWVLKMSNASYFTRDAPFPELAAAVTRLVAGERVFDPAVISRIQQTAHGWQFCANGNSTPITCLTRREVEVLTLVALGHSIKHCAKVLSLAPSTVDNHKARLMKKLGIHKSHELTRLAIREGLVTV
jgi:DNA-binding NarL/FixJ family response regulator